MPATRQATYVAAIREAFPDLTIDSAWMIEDQGQHNDVLVINDGLVFRFPKSADGALILGTEIALLRAIGDRLPLPVPDPVYSQYDAQRGVASFMGYTMLPGTPLWRQVVQDITDDAILQRLAAPLAEFLLALHAIDPADLNIQLDRRDGLSYWRKMYHEINRELYPDMRPEDVAQITAQFEQFFARLEQFDYQPVLRHGDLGGSNILHDPEMHTITGVIDFGAVAIGDPATDVASIATLGERFFAHFRQVYPVDDEMIERTVFYRETFALQEALIAKITGVQDEFLSGTTGYN